MTHSFDMDDTIAAPATAPGQAAVGILRISGPETRAVLATMFKSRGGTLRPRHMVYGDILDADGQNIDDGLCVYFAGPASYTGQDSAELQLHGSALIMARALEAAVSAGARLAQPGEFTRRAFMNGKLDLSAAEAVMDVIGAQSDGAHRLAQRQLRGELFGRISAIQGDLTDLLARIGVTVDYPEEDIEDETAQHCLAGIEQCATAIESLLAHAHTGQVLREGARCAIVGLPNAGKSTLLNALCGQDRAIVTPTPGTTRDTLEATVDIHGLAVTAVDTAGLRQSGDQVEQLGVARAREALAQADAVLVAVDASLPLSDDVKELLQEAKGRPGIVLRTKCDLCAAVTPEELHLATSLPVMDISAATGQGMREMTRALYDLLCGGAQLSSVALSNTRHIQAARDAAQALAMARQTLDMGFTPDTASVDIQRAWTALGLITGQTAAQSVVDTIFSKFCLGK